MLESVKKGKSNARDYSEQEKWKAVTMVEKKGFKAASDSTGVCLQTLQKWKRMYGGTAKPEKAKPVKAEAEIVEHIEVEKEPEKAVAVYDHGFAGEVMRTKDEVLKRMQAVIPTEEDLSKLTQALKLLNDINTQGNDRESTPVIKSWYQQINLTIEKLNQINTNGHKDSTN